MAITTTTATTPDYDEIVRVVQLYIDGWKSDANKFKEAFHEDAWIFSPMPMGSSTKVSSPTVSRHGPPRINTSWVASFL